MASSDEIKERIHHYFDCTGVPNVEKDWKRTSKRNLNGQTLREFENKTLGRSVYTLGDDEDAEVIEKGQWIYGYVKMDDGQLCLSIEPLGRWQREGHTYDQHQLNAVLTMFLLPDDLLDEASENSFYVNPSYNELALHMLMKKHRILHDPSYSAFLGDTNLSPAPFAIPNPLPQFPALDPAFVPATPKTNQPAQQLLTSITSNMTPKPTTPAVTAPSNTGALGGFYGTGLEEDGSAKPSDFIAAVYDDDGEVLVSITPMMSFARGDAFDRNVGSLVDHLLPVGWYETSEQTYTPDGLTMPEAFDFLLQAGFNVDWKEFKDQFKSSYDLYDVTREQHKSNMDLIANPVSTMPVHHHNPVPVTAQAPNNTGYPELTGQLPEVQAALTGARVRGELGLEQESSKWDDNEDIEKNWVANEKYPITADEFTVELERSHALWLLYEKYDQGSGLAFPNFFGMDNVRLSEEVGKILDLDDVDDEETFIEILEDKQTYPAPYDLPVPEYVAPQPIIQAPVIQTSKPVPKAPKQVARGPSQGKMTGSGSFAPLAAAPAAVADEDETPMDAEPIKFDAGEQWPEFCGAIWDHFTKHGAGPVEWWDRFRPRHARIIGLGYKFDRVEFTGIRVQMGYLNEKFQIIDNIDIPGAVFDELFPDGGEWNDDENVQMINKQPGVNEDGFSHSSQDLWATVEPMLRAKGWLPAK